MVDHIDVLPAGDRRTRVAGLAGFAGTGLLAVALLLPGVPPRTDEPSRQILAFALAHRTELLLGTFFAALAMLGLLWFIAGVWRALQGAADETVLAAGALAGAAGLVFVLMGVVVVSGLVLEAVRSGDLVLVRIVTDTSNILIQVGLIGLGGFAIATVLAGRTHELMPRWVVWLGALAAILVVGISLPALLAQGGAWQFGGAAALASIGPLMVWFVALAISMMRLPAKRSSRVAATAST
jgi:hypothetical protein